MYFLIKYWKKKNIIRPILYYLYKSLHLVLFFCIKSWILQYIVFGIHFPISLASFRFNNRQKETAL